MRPITIRTATISMLILFLSACSTMSDVVADKAGGTARIYDVPVDQAWNIAKTVFRWGGADAIEEHRDNNYMLTSSGMNLVTYGAVMGAWVDPVDDAHSRVTVVTKRRISINVFTTMREKTFHKMFTQAVDIVHSGAQLPSEAPPDKK